MGQHMPNRAAFMAALTATNVIDSIEREQIAAASLRIFDTVPEGLEAIAVTDGGAPPLIEHGEVAVYERLDYIESLEEGGLYVVEYQRTPACMPDAMWAENFLDLARRTPLVSSRKVRRIARDSRDRDLWWSHPLIPMAASWTPDMPQRLRLSDGPMQRWNLADQIVGRVVGIYNPAAIRTGGRA